LTTNAAINCGEQDTSQQIMIRKLILDLMFFCVS